MGISRVHLWTTWRTLAGVTANRSSPCIATKSRTSKILRLQTTRSFLLLVVILAFSASPRLFLAGHPRETLKTPVHSVHYPLSKEGQGYLLPRIGHISGLNTVKSVDQRLPRRVTASGGDQTTLAFAIAALSSFFNGSFPACQRIPAAPLDPVLFNGIVCLGVFLSSLFVPLGAGTPYVFTAGGAFGGVLFVFAALFSFLAIPRAGLATAQAVWSCSAIIVSFAWGAFGPAEIAVQVKDLPLSLGALLLLVAGALVIVSCDSIAKQLSSDGDKEGKAVETSESEAAGGDRVLGLAFAAAVGLFGGSVLVPFKFIPADVAGLAAVPSFGLGALIAGVVVTAGYWRFVLDESDLPKVPSDAILAGVASGILWNAGNVCSIIAQGPPFSLPYGIAYPILQCALFFGGLWGIFVFKEITGNAVSVFWAGALTLASGIVALSLYGPGAT